MNNESEVWRNMERQEKSVVNKGTSKEEDINAPQRKRKL